MMTVDISVNGKTVYARSACRVKDCVDGSADYHVDTGETINHNPDDGIVKLALKLVKTIKEESK